MQKRENVIRTIKRQSPEWVPYRGDGSFQFLRSNIICVRPEMGGVDDWGVNWLYNKNDGSYPDNNAVIDINDLANFKAPDTDWKAVTEDMQLQALEWRQKDCIVIAYNELSMFERIQLLLGFEGFMFALIDYRDEFEKLLTMIYEYNTRLVKALMESGVDGIRFTDDWGMQDRLFISPEDWRGFFKSKYLKLYKLVKENGGFVFQHSCGNLESIIQDIAGMGIDVLDPCQPLANDIVTWKQNYGDRLSFMGGLDTQSYLSFETPQGVYEKVYEMVKALDCNGGYIAAPSHTIAIPEGNRIAMIQAINKYNDEKRRDNA